MKCEDLQINLPLYTDDVLTDAERASLDDHLAACPLCRQKLADFQTLRNSMRSLARPAIPQTVLNSIRTAVAAQLPASSSPQFFVFRETRGSWLQKRLMPYTIGAFASVILGLTLLWTLLSTVNQANSPSDLAQSPTLSNRTILIANGNPDGGGDPFDLTARQYASERLAVANESPSVNPQGALIALTKSLVRGDMKDDEVVVVADVFGNGLAQIEEVIEPSNNRQAVYELKKALQSDAAYAPFVPANFDRRSESVRVVLKIQSVDVKTNLNSTSQ